MLLAIVGEPDQQKMPPPSYKTFGKLLLAMLLLTIITGDCSQYMPAPEHALLLVMMLFATVDEQLLMQ